MRIEFRNFFLDKNFRKGQNSKMDLKKILASKKAPIVESSPTIPIESYKEILPPVNDEVVAAIFLLHIRKPNDLTLAELWQAFQIPYKPWTLKASSEHPPKELVLAVIHYYMRTTPSTINSISLTSYVLVGVGRILNDNQIAILISYLERSK